MPKQAFEVSIPCIQLGPHMLMVYMNVDRFKIVYLNVIRCKELRYLYIYCQLSVHLVCRVKFKLSHCFDFNWADATCVGSYQEQKLLPEQLHGHLFLT